MSDAPAGQGARAGAATSLRRIGLLLGVAMMVAALLLLLAGPALYRAGMASLDQAQNSLTGIAFYLALGAIVLSFATLVGSGIARRSRGVIMSVVVLIAGSIAGFRIYAYDIERDTLPPLNDAQTDWNMPVAFTEKALADREAAGAAPIRDDAVMPQGTGKWAGVSIAKAGQEAYGLEPLKVKIAPPEVTVTVTTAAKRLGWDVTLSDPPGGVVEAVNHSVWYGLASDIAVRVTPDGTGSRIDVRSVSRTPGHDMGANAARVKDLIDEIALELR